MNSVGNNLRSISRLGARSSLIALAVAASTPAFAQESEAAKDETATAPAASGEADIVVTGSRIRRDGYDTVQPTTVVSGDLIENRAANSIGEVLNEMPSFGVPGQTPVGGANSGGRVTTGQSFVNFFGLGSQRSLTLINGVRFPGSNTPSANGRSPGQQVDLNMVPTGLIERVETIAVGGAPIYGADAIAGTINVIMKKRFTGFDATVTAGISDYGDAAKYRAQALYGVDFAGGNGNIVANVEYNHQSGLKETDRPLTAAQYSFQAPPGGSTSAFDNVVFPNTRYLLTSAGGVILTNREFITFGGGAQDAQGNYLQFGPNGDIIPYNTGTNITGVAASGGDGINLGENATLLGESDRYLGNLFLNYDFSPSLRFRLEGWLSHTKAIGTANQVDYNSVFSARAGDNDRRFDNGPYVIRLDNPFLTAQARAIIGQATDLDGNGTPDAILDLDGNGTPETQGFYLDKANRALQGDRPSRARQTLYRVLGSLEGDFEVGARKFNWSVAAAYGETRSKFQQNATLVDRLNQAVDAVRDPGSGQIVCRDRSNGCLPYNVFLGSADQAVKDFVTADISSRTKITQTLVTANISGPLFRLPGGDLSIATGVDYRRESSAFDPDAISRSGQPRGFPTASVSGSFESREIYGELLAPLIAPSMNVPLIHKLSVEGAIRYVDNSLAGGDITWTAGGRWAPIADIEFRGNFTRSIRAPAITELFLPSSQVLSFASDPCDSRFVGAGANPQRRAANCAAAGITQPFSSNIVSAARPITLAGNQNLTNEEANSWTVGAILTPTFIPGLVASVDWVNIKLTNSIESLNATTLLQSCYDSASYPTAPVCQQFTRNSAGQITSVTTGFVNAGSVRFEGLTANLGYSFDIGNLGRIALSGNYQYTKRLDFSVTGSDLDRRAGEIGNSKHRGSASVTWSKDGFSLFTQGVFVGKAVFDNEDSPTTRDLRGVGNWVVFNSTIGYDVNDAFGLRLAVNNLFDRAAPLGAVVDNAGVSTYFAGLLGRTYSVSARVRF